MRNASLISIQVTSSSTLQVAGPATPAQAAIPAAVVADIPAHTVAAPVPAAIPATVPAAVPAAIPAVVCTAAAETTIAPVNEKCRPRPAPPPQGISSPGNACTNTHGTPASGQSAITAQQHFRQTPAAAAACAKEVTSPVKFAERAGDAGCVVFASPPRAAPRAIEKARGESCPLFRAQLHCPLHVACDERQLPITASLHMPSLCFARATRFVCCCPACVASSASHAHAACHAPVGSLTRESSPLVCATSQSEWNVQQPRAVTLRCGAVIDPMAFMVPTNAAVLPTDVTKSVKLAIKAAGPRLTVRVSGDAPAVPAQLGGSIGSPPAVRHEALQAAPHAASVDRGSAQPSDGKEGKLLMGAPGVGALKRQRDDAGSGMSRAVTPRFAGAGQRAWHVPAAPAHAFGVQRPASPQQLKRGRRDEDAADGMPPVSKRVSRRKPVRVTRAEN